ncbi:DEAD/DEAH box helicase [Piscinibacter gummiphilus]|uniref:DEAD/DEAH box helicase n=1 Tax=Piscinibacter gummiphilus TaxID=946333 RepID=A0ABZ0CUQ7_9BURK|nr:DEAD/DEAH box helicase [Piscinibacter gummiphilus]WOB06690.1 DEAD/DEAH box helicase [Piscinibacter gummiphilus]
MSSFSLPEDFDLGEHFDHRTLIRAMELKPQQAVTALQVDGPRLVSRVQGTGPTAYQQHIQWVEDRRLGPKLEGRCSCPAGHNCQHVAAALMAFEAQQIRIKKGLPEKPGIATPVARPAPPPPPEMLELGALALVPVLRLTTCVDVASEALLHHRYGSAQARASTLRQGAAQLLYRYQPPVGKALDYHAPAGTATTTLAEVIDPQRPGRIVMGHFQRQSLAEAAALRSLVGELDLRPWSLSAGLAVERATRQSMLRQPAHTQAQGGPEVHSPMLLVPQRRDRWPELLAHHIPELERRGWVVEVADDFPYELHQADDWSVDIGEEPGGHWFNVGLRVTVDGEPVNLVPLLVSLVQNGWLDTEALVGRGEGSEVLVPWSVEAAPTPGTAPRQRLLRLPVARVLPLMEWLRSVFRMGERTSALRLSRFDLGTLESLEQAGRVTAPPSYTELMEQVKLLNADGGLPAIDASPNVQATLRHYQLDGLAWMDFLRRSRLGGILADDMGLGKTLQALALLQAELDAGRLDRPSLVIVPTSLIGNWETEARRFTPQLKLVVLHGAQRARHFKEIAGAHLVVTSYPLAMRDMATHGVQEWHYVMLDEAQRIKNSRSQAALSVKELNARHRLCLSGTPLENHLGELWSLIDFVCPGLLGSEAQFREHYRTPIERRQDTLRAQQLARRVKPFLLRRTKQQVARELPEKTETLLRVELTGTQRDLYETVRATMDSKLREVIAQQGLARSQIMVLDALLRLRQVCCDPRLLKTGDNADRGDAPARPHHPSAKMELLLDLLPTLVEDGRRVLLFSQFTEMLGLIELELQRLKLPYLLLTGETKDRGALVEKFQQGNTPLFLISLKAGGVGLNLTAADTVILYDPWWNPAVEQQAIDRAYRIGQDKPVFVYKLLASGTVEDKMLDLQARKAGLADSLLSGVASDAALTTQDFDELFKPLGGE